MNRNLQRLICIGSMAIAVIFIYSRSLFTQNHRKTIVLDNLDSIQSSSLSLGIIHTDLKPTHNLVIPKSEPPRQHLKTISCEPGIPCQYEEEVDLRIIVMVYNRADSMVKCLDSLQDLELGNATAVVEIWIDRSKAGGVDNRTVQAALNFHWNKGEVRTHIQQKHAGIYGQWIDTWRPKENSKELAIFLEDDVDMSKYAYKWLVAAHKFYKDREDVAGYSLYEGAMVGNCRLPPQYSTLMHSRLGSQGFAPHPDRWRKFQDWFHEKRKDPSFHPYIKDDPTLTSWYKSFESQKKADSMWTIWHIHYTDTLKMYTVYPNIGAYMNGKDKSFRSSQYLAYHRQEKGLHFFGKGRSSSDKLIQTWSDDYLQFPHEPPKYYYNCKVVNTPKL